MNPGDFPEKFSAAVLNYLWYLEENISDISIAASFVNVEKAGESVPGIGNVFEFVTETAKSVFVLSVTHPNFRKILENYFKKNEISRINVFTFITKYCFTYHSVTNDIFEVVLNITTFVYLLVNFCVAKEQYEFALFASMMWTEIFMVDLKAEFQANGDWKQFRKYVAEKRYREGIRHKSGRTSSLREIVTFLEDIDYLTLTVERVEEAQAAGLFLTDNIPELRAKLGDILGPFQEANTRILKLLEESKEKPSDQSSLPSGESSTSDIEQLSRACLSLQLKAPDHCSNEPVPENEPVAENEPSIEIQNNSKESLV